MIRICQLKLPVDTDAGKVAELLMKQVREKLRVRSEQIRSLDIVRRSLDARRSHEISFSYTVDVSLHQESAVWKAQKQKKDLELRDGVDFEKREYPALELLRSEKCAPADPPVVIGFGPAGIFASLLLAKAGLCPVVLERGSSIEQRVQDVSSFWESGTLNTESNVQFGEGGAGTFSDGKLNTLIKDREGIGRFVLRKFVEAGGPEDILYDQKPHIGTDRLRKVIVNLRSEIEKDGGKVLFHAKVTDLEPMEGKKVRITYLQDGKEHHRITEAVFLGIGHSARDTFLMLERRGMLLEPKAFAVGLRIEHPQSWINRTQYRALAGHPALKAAPYKVSAQVETNGVSRGVYSFCMCPGGFVVPAASEEQGVVTNGMSNYGRDEENGNAALLVTITPEDYRTCEDGELKGILAGAAFSRKLEKAAFRMGGGNYAAPAQYTGDFLRDCGENVQSDASIFDAVQPSYSRGVKEAHLCELFPQEISTALAKGISAIDKSMHGFACSGSILTGVESRSSSPIRMIRNESFEAVIPGIFPIGEGAGYAGGIMSAAVDGIKSALSYLKRFAQ